MVTIWFELENLTMFNESDYIEAIELIFSEVVSNGELVKLPKFDKDYGFFTQNSIWGITCKTYEVEDVLQGLLAFGKVKLLFSW